MLLPSTSCPGGANMSQQTATSASICRIARRAQHKEASPKPATHELLRRDARRTRCASVGVLKCDDVGSAGVGGRLVAVAQLPHAQTPRRLLAARRAAKAHGRHRSTARPRGDMAGGLCAASGRWLSRAWLLVLLPAASRSSDAAGFGVRRPDHSDSMSPSTKQVRNNERHHSGVASKGRTAVCMTGFARSLFAKFPDELNKKREDA